ncbi:hypothetical protein X801_01253, partial [Opisthorchis viverrini]
WAQGAKGFELGFVDNNVLCVRSGPTVRFQDVETKKSTLFRLCSNAPSSLVVHPSEPYLAVSELYKTNPRVFVYHYPDMQETILRGGGKLELKQTAFSHSFYLVTVSGIPDFLLSLWDFEQGLLLCQVPLNGIYLTTISFCPLNWRWIVATDARCFYFWQVESCNQITLLRCKKIAYSRRYMRLPEQSAPLGVYEDSVQKGITCPSQVPDHTRFDPNLPTSAISGMLCSLRHVTCSGVGEAKQMEFEDYLDDADHVFCVSQTWSNTDLVFIGCKNGELLLLLDHTDSPPETRIIPVTAEATQSSEVTEHSENEIDSLAIPSGAFHFLLYTKFGLLCAGRDGLLRILRVNSRMIEMPIHTKRTDSAPVSNNCSQLLRTGITSCKILYKFPNPFHENRGQSTPSITRLCVSPSFGRLLLGSRSGQIVLLNISCDLLAIEGSINPECELLTSNDSFVGLGILGPEKTKTARRSGVINTWDCESGRLLGSLAVGEQCFSVTVSSVIPVAAVGTRSGVLLMLDCSEPTTLRVVESIKLFHNPLSHLEFDARGDLLIAAADDEYSVVLAGRPKNKFEPLGFVPITGKVNDLTIMRHGPKKIFVLVTMGLSTSSAATELYFYELTLAMLFNSPHSVVDSCLGLRADTIRLMQLHFNIPTISVCLWPPRDDSVSAPPTLFAVDSRGKQLLTYVLPEEPSARPAQTLSIHSRAVSSSRPVGSSNAHLGHSGSGTFAISGRHDHSGHVGTSLLRYNSRKTKLTTGLTLRLTPALIQTISTADGQDNTEDTTQINAMAEENEELPEIQRIGRQEFELDVDEQAAIVEDTEKAVKQTRQEIQLSDLANQFTWHVLKNRCWDEMRVKGRILRAFGSQLEVCNFPLRSRSREDLDRLNAVRTRRTIQIHLAGMFSRMNESAFGASDTPLMLPAGQNEEPDEDDEQEVVVNRVLDGSIAMDWGGPGELCYSQLDLYTREQKIYQIVLVEDNIFQIKETFNKRFDEVYQKKDSGLQKIRTRLERIRKILVDIQQPNAAKSVIDPAFSPEEQPELLLTVTDSEIKAERYLSPAEIAELETRRLAEEERRRRDMLDNWRERGLEEMMGGVLEVRKEDELKKDVPKPAFLITRKPLVHWTADDRRLYAEYERKVQELNEEREKYRKFLEGEMKTLYAAIDEEKLKFDEQLVALFNDWIRVQIAVVHEELKIWRLKWMLLVEEELFVHENELRQQLEKIDQEEAGIIRTLESAKEILEQEKEGYDLLCAEDKLLEKNFRKEFADVHGPLYDYISRAFRRRPKRIGPVSSTHIESDTGENSDAILCTNVYNPYSEKAAHKRILGYTKKDLEECFRELDNDPAREGQPPLDNAVWERLCKYRRRKFEKEMQVKNNALKLADINAFVQRREEELRAVRARRETLINNLNSSLKDYHRNQTDLELQLLVKQGQVEVDLVEGNLVRDYSDALLINRDQVEELNAHIIKFGEYKVAHLIRNKEFKRRFYHLEWELRRMLMQYEDVQTKLNDIRKFKITREVQKYLQTNDYDGMINAQVVTLEHTMNLMRQTHAKAMEQKRRRLRRYQEVQGEKLKAENENLKTDLKELNVELHETKFIHDQNRCVGTKRPTGPPRYKLLVQQQRLMQLANEQAKEIKTLRKQLAQLQEQKKLLR